MYWRILLLCFFLFASTFLFSQNSKIIRGVVINKESNKGVPYASIQVLNSSIGIISNFSGEFRLHVQGSLLQDTLKISSIGFRTVYLPMTSLLDSGFLTIRLALRVYSLEEISIRKKRSKALQAEEVVRKAINRVKNNCPERAILLHGYYRDYLWKDNNYYNLMEAALKVYDPGIKKYDHKQTQVAIEQFRFRDDFNIDTSYTDSYIAGTKEVPSMQMQYKGRNEFSILRLHDPIRNYRHPSFAFVFILNKYFLNFHSFRIDSLLIQEGELLYEISFSLVDDPDYPHIIDGKIYVRASDFAILKFSYKNIFPPEEAYQGNRYEVQIEYQEYKGQMVLKYVSVNNFLLARTGNPSFKIDTIRADTQANRIVLQFNKALDFRTSGDPKKYKVWIGGLRYKIDQVIHSDMNEVSIPLAKKFHLKKTDKIKVEVEGLLSAYGEVLNLFPTESMYQYREFFVNKIGLSDDGLEAKEKFMDKDLPLHYHSVKEIPGFWESYNFVLSQALKKD